MDSKATERRFIEMMSSWLASLPFDLKILYDAVDDENLDRKGRELIVGAIIYAISPNDAIADRHDSFASYCDDCILVRLALRQALDSDSHSEDAEYFKSRFPEFFEALPSELALCEKAMGELYHWLAAKLPTLSKLEYKGKSVSTYLDDEEAGEVLREDGLVFTTEYPVEEDTLGDKLKKASTILEALRRRRADEPGRG